MKKHLLIWLAVVLLLTGCSQLIAKRIYNTTDKLLIYQLDKYFDLTSDQEDLLKPRLRLLLETHRQKVLPVVADFVRDLKQKLSATALTPQAYDGIVTGLNNMRLRHVNLMAPTALDFLVTVQPRQLMHLEEEWEEFNQDKEEEREEDDYEEEMIDTWRDAYEDLFGDLTPQQQGMVDEVVRYMIRYWKLRDVQRRVSQKKFLDFMHANPNRGEIEQGPIAWFKDVTITLTDSFREARKRKSTYLKGHYLRFFASLSGDQKQHLSEQLDFYANLIARLRT